MGWVPTPPSKRAAKSLLLREKISGEMWEESIAAFRSDLEELVGLALNRDIDLSSPIPYGGDHTYLREILLAADHNAYHLGQIVQLKEYFDASLCT